MFHRKKSQLLTEYYDELLLNQAKSFINWWMNEDMLNKSV